MDLLREPLRSEHQPPQPRLAPQALSSCIRGGGRRGAKEGRRKSQAAACDRGKLQNDPWWGSSTVGFLVEGAYELGWEGWAQPGDRLSVADRRALGWGSGAERTRPGSWSRGRASRRPRAGQHGPDKAATPAFCRRTCPVTPPWHEGSPSQDGVPRKQVQEGRPSSVPTL